MCALKKKALGRISVWTLIFALLLTILSASMLSVHAENFLGDKAREAASDVGDAVSDAGNAVSDAVSDALDMKPSDGAANDGDGIIGNESAEAASTDDVKKEDRNSGWIGVVVAILIVVIVVVLIIILIPKKKKY
ncbi:MAG: hypothetical protein IJX94_06235 [Clostridia bacterium]|nr:hypothetical protein [Clostridia bacterium]